MGKFIQSMGDHCIKVPLIIYLILMRSSIIEVHGADEVPITFLQSAVPKGAVCLDGTPPAYYYYKGSGDGSNNWVVHLEGGGWCGSNAHCPQYGKAKSSLEKPNRGYFRGILSSNQTTNPEFYNWNKVYVVYCDGSSFMSNVQSTIPVTRRGARIYDAIMEELQTKGLKDAKKAILSGESAGGLAAILHCDAFKAFVPNAALFKCISDSGFFIRANTTMIPGQATRVNRFRAVIDYHELQDKLLKACTSKQNYYECMFPENLVNDIQTPLFILESSYDSYQMGSGIEHGPEYDTSTWTNCIEKLQSCNPTTIQYMKEYRGELLKILEGIGKSGSRGVFVHTCIRHGHITHSNGWHLSPIVAQNTIAKAIGDWYFDRAPVYVIETRTVEPKVCSP